MKYLNGIIDSINRVAPIDPDAQLFFNRVTAAGGSLTGTEKTAVNVLVINLKAQNLWSSLLSIYPMVGGSAASCAQNLVSGTFTGTFSGGWTFSSTGAKPNGVNAYMQTNFNFRANTTGYDQHISMYSRTQDSSVDGVQVGGYDGTDEINLYQYFASIATKGTNMFVYPSRVANVVDTNTLGLQIGTRISNNSLNLYFRGIFRNNNANTETLQAPNVNVFIAATNVNNTVIFQYSPHENAFTSFGTALTSLQPSNLNTIVQTFQTSLSRAV